MTITQQRCTCKCGHVFDADMIANAPIAVVTASMEAIRCPKCGGNKIGLGGAYRDNPQPGSSTIAERAKWWIRRGAVGISSQTIWGAFTGGYIDYPDWPHDPDDYSRCRALFDLIPEWCADLSPIVAKYPWFKPFADRWSEFDALWDEESPRKRCPKLYALLKIAAREGDAIRRMAA